MREDKNVSVLIQDRGIIYEAVRDHINSSENNIEDIKEMISIYIRDNIEVDNEKMAITVII